MHTFAKKSGVGSVPWKAKIEGRQPLELRMDVNSGGWDRSPAANRLPMSGVLPPDTGTHGRPISRGGGRQGAQRCNDFISRARPRRPAPPQAGRSTNCGSVSLPTGTWTRAASAPGRVSLITLRGAWRAAGCEIVPIYDLEEPPLFVRKVRQAFWKYVRGKRYLRDVEPGVLRAYAREIMRRLPAANVDVLFSPSSRLLSFVETDCADRFLDRGDFQLHDRVLRRLHQLGPGEPRGRPRRRGCRVASIARSPSTPPNGGRAAPWRTTVRTRRR